jgi:uncharacterized membrane protein YphA (DoxX/SURF4 family)
MSIVRAIARPLLAATFITRGIDALLHPMSRAERAAPLVSRLARFEGAGRLTKDPELLVRGNGAVMVGAGVLLATGTAPRVSALALAAAGLPATYLDHPFWAIEDPEHRRDQRSLFLRDVGLVGGLLLAAVDTEGRPGLVWRGRHAVTEVERSAHRASKQAHRAWRPARWAGRQLRRQARLEAREAMRSAQKAARRTAQRAAEEVLPA